VGPRAGRDILKKRRKKNSVPAGIQTSDRPACNLVIKLVTVSWLHYTGQVNLIIQEYGILIHLTQLAWQ
jgi:hypothetical protein